MTKAITIEEAQKICKNLNQTFKSGKTLSYYYRMDQLTALQKMLSENTDKLCKALYDDLGKPGFEASLCEIDLLTKEVVEAKRNLHHWMAPEPAERDIATMVNTLEKRRDPMGLTLILGAWNYPIVLALGPLVGSIAGGNVTFVKPASAAKACSDLLCALIPKYLDPEATVCHAMARGNSGKLVPEIRFEHIFFTGGAIVGRQIMSDAAKHLSRLTLELGGKNPCYVEDGADVDHTCARIMWAKNCNAGQICINVDYILCSKQMQEKLIAGFKKVLKQFHPKEGGQFQSKDYCKQISKSRYEELEGWMKRMPGHKLAIGGQKDPKRNVIETTIYKDVTDQDSIMEDEIFGPLMGILPICNSVNDAIKFVNDHDKPLAAYIFSNNEKSIEKYLNQTTSGGVSVNDVMVHYTCDSLPFGGVGNSGCGAYHGKYTFDCFTHEKGVYKQSAVGKQLMKLGNPPYTNFKSKLLTLALVGPPFNYKGLMSKIGSLIHLGVYVSCIYLAYDKFVKNM